MSRIASRPGERFTVHTAAASAHDVSVIRLGRSAVIDPTADIAADRADAEELASWSIREARPARITPGSYVWCDGPPIPGGALTVGLWVRPWLVPEIDRVQIAWSVLLGDIDYPDACRFGLLIDHVGRIAAYSGDGGPLRHDRFAHTAPIIGARLGAWLHVACVWDGERARILVDGMEVAAELAPPIAEPTTASRLRIGAMAEGGLADDLLDADISRPFIAAGAITDADIGRVVADKGRRHISELRIGQLLAEWPLDEEHGSIVADHSGHGRHGTIVNHGTWMVGGPAFDATGREPGVYSPSADPDRGHGLRLSSDDLIDAGWAAAAEYSVPPDAESGFYAVRVRQPGQAPEQTLATPFVISRREPRESGSIALLAATNTWIVYARRPLAGQPIAGLNSSCYSNHTNGRPFFHVGTRLPMPLADPFVFESRRSERTQSHHLGRPERMADAWLTANGYAHEVITDLDLHEEPGLLARFAALLICGHSEYWTPEMRQGVSDYLAGGGNVISMSGDTLSVRVTYEEDCAAIEARKITRDDDPRWLTRDWWGERWHAHDGLPGGSWRLMGAPAWDLIGAGFKGMLDDGVAASFEPYRVLLAMHPLLTTPEVVPVTPQGTIGDRSLNGRGGASGYEFDASPHHSGLALRPVEGVETLASASPQHNLEWLGDPQHGADLLYWKRPAGGRVLTFGSIAVAGCLPVDEGIATLMRNALAHFGVTRHGAVA